MSGRGMSMSWPYKLRWGRWTQVWSRSSAGLTVGALLDLVTEFRTQTVSQWQVYYVLAENACVPDSRTFTAHLRSIRNFVSFRCFEELCFFCHKFLLHLTRPPTRNYLLEKLIIHEKNNWNCLRGCGIDYGLKFWLSQQISELFISHMHVHIQVAIILIYWEKLTPQLLLQHWVKE